MAMLDEALDLLCKREFSVIPLRPRDKKPLLASWAEYQRRRPTEEEVEQWWTQWPDANIGIVTGAVSGLVVVDVDGEEGLNWMRVNMPVTSVYVKTGKGWHGYFRHPGGQIGNRARLAPEVDLRADGGYVVAPPSIHASGHQYEWVFTPGLDGWDGLAEFAPAERQPKPGLGIDLSGAKPMLTAEPVAKGQRNNRLAELTGKWITVNKLGIDECLLMARGWNGTLEQPLANAELEKTVQSVFHTHQRNHPGEDAPEAVALPAEPEEFSLPESVLHPGGLLGELMDYTEKASAVSHPVFALAGAIAAVGTLAGQKFMTETGLRTNFYCLALGYSGAGKDSPQAAIPQVFIKAGQNAQNCLAGNSVSSEAAILRWLANDAHASALYLLDEIGLLLTAMKRPMSPAAEIPALLMKLFSSTDRAYSRQYADENNNILVKWHHLSMYGASTPDRFWESMTRGEATDGFLARCLIFESRHDVERPKKRTDTAVPADLLTHVKELAGLPRTVDDSNGNLSAPVPRTVEKDANAAAYFEAWAERYFELRNKYLKTDEGLSSLYGRAAEHAHKLALLHAISLDGKDTRTVRMPSVQWACALVDALLTNAAAQMQGNIAESDFHKLTQRAVKAVRGYVLSHKGKIGAPRWVLEKNLKGVDTIMVDRVLKKLLSEGSLVEKPSDNAQGPKTTLFCLAEVHDG